MALYNIMDTLQMSMLKNPHDQPFSLVPRPRPPIRVCISERDRPCHVHVLKFELELRTDTCVRVPCRMLRSCLFRTLRPTIRVLPSQGMKIYL